MALVPFTLVATPLLAFAGALLGHWLNRRSAAELDRWRRGEETMRMLRWATEIALDDDPRRCEAGAAILAALLRSPLVEPVDVEMVSSVATSASDRLSRAGPGDVPS
jgi:hypothetical protein